MRHRSRIVFALSAAALLGGGAPPAPTVADGALSIGVTGLRSSRGQVLACLTSQARGFPDCRRDPTAHKLAIPAAGTVILDFGHVAPGRYAVSLLHDENGNGKADMVLMFPREGFGFSRDAAVRFGPPRFDEAAFDIGSANVRQTIRMRYMF